MNDLGFESLDRLRCVLDTIMILRFKEPTVVYSNAHWKTQFGVPDEDLMEMLWSWPDKTYIEREIWIDNAKPWLPVFLKQVIHAFGVALPLNLHLFNATPSSYVTAVASLQLYAQDRYQERPERFWGAEAADLAVAQAMNLKIFVPFVLRPAIEKEVPVERYH